MLERLSELRFTRAEILQFVRFCIVGVVAFVCHYGCYYLLQRIIDVNVAYTAGYCISMICNFFMTSYFTFRKRPSLSKALGFAMSHGLNYVLHIVLFNIFLHIGISRELSPILVLSIAVPVNFLLLRYVFTRLKITSNDCF